MKRLILSDLHAELKTFEVAKDLDYDVDVLAGDIMAPIRAAANWLPLTQGKRVPAIDHL